MEKEQETDQLMGITRTSRCRAIARERGPPPLLHGPWGDGLFHPVP